MKYHLCLALLLFSFNAYGDGGFQVEMPSGLIAYVYSVNKLNIDGVNTLTLDYESNINIKNNDDMQLELSKVWEGFIKKCNNAKVSAALIRPRNTIKKNNTGLFTSGTANVRWFYKHINSSGKWVSGKKKNNKGQSKTSRAKTQSRQEEIF